jgi:hypothetical protein
MRPTYGVPQDDGSRRSHRCPPSHHEMALMPEYAQASTRAPQPSQPSTGSPMSSAPAFPYHQQGSTMPSAAPAAYSPRHLVPFASMGGGKSPHAAARSLVWVDGTLTCYHRGNTAIARLGSSFTTSSVLSLPPTPNHGGDSQRGHGTLACYHRGGNAIAKLGPSFLADSVFSHPPSTNNGG